MPADAWRPEVVMPFQVTSPVLSDAELMWRDHTVRPDASEMLIVMRPENPAEPCGNWKVKGVALWPTRMTKEPEAMPTGVVVSTAELLVVVVVVAVSVRVTTTL
jgi:hypothetical protein